MRFIDRFLNRITMYRLALYYLGALVLLAVILAAFGLVPYSPIAILVSTAILLVAAWGTNALFARATGAATNAESYLITALILALLVTPASYANPTGLALIALLGVWAMASKYLFAIGKRHLFNPAAFALALSALIFGVPQSWWAAGNIYLLPAIIAGGLLLTRKIRRFDTVLAFAAVALAAVALTAYDPLLAITATLTRSSFFFLALVMLTEPLTLPPSRSLRILYGALVGFLFAPNIHLGSLYFTPELALLIGNLASYITGPKGRYMLTLSSRQKLAEGVYEFSFVPDRPISFRPGQYLEWTLPHAKSDARGNRRYFTIASAPEDELVRLGVKFNDPPSSYKRALADLERGATLSVGSLAGDFVLPRTAPHKLAFIAGGIGVTPFRSMLGHLLATGERRDIVLLYSTKSEAEVVYRDLFARAERELGVKVSYVRLIDEQMIRELIPDYRKRTFYLSGPDAMVSSFRKMLRHLGVYGVKTDYFPGF